MHAGTRNASEHANTPSHALVRAYLSTHNTRVRRTLLDVYTRLSLSAMNGNGWSFWMHLSRAERNIYIISPFSRTYNLMKFFTWNRSSLNYRAFLLRLWTPWQDLKQNLLWKKWPFFLNRQIDQQLSTIPFLSPPHLENFEVVWWNFSPTHSLTSYNISYNTEHRHKIPYTFFFFRSHSFSNRASIPTEEHHRNFPTFYI